MKSTSQGSGYFWGPEKLSVSPRKIAALNTKDPSLITIPLGGTLTVNHVNLFCELTVCVDGLIEDFAIITEHHKMSD